MDEREREKVELSVTSNRVKSISLNSQLTSMHAFESELDKVRIIRPSFYTSISS